MTRRENLLRAFDLCDAAKVSLTTAAAFDGRDMDQYRRFQISAEAALSEAIDLIWQSAEPARDRFFRVAAEIAARPANDFENDDRTPPPVAGASLQRTAA